MAVGKRLDKDEPLTEHDVAERLSKALERVARITADVVADPALHQAVQGSRYLVGGLPEQVQGLLASLLRGKHGYCSVCRDGGFADDGHQRVDP